MLTMAWEFSNVLTLRNIYGLKICNSFLLRLLKSRIPTARYVYFMYIILCIIYFAILFEIL